MGLLDNLSKIGNNNLLPLEFVQPSEEDLIRIKKDLTSVLRKKIFLQYMICIIAGMLAIGLPIGCFRNATWDFKTIIITIITVQVCLGGIGYVVMVSIPKHKRIYNNFKKGLFGVFTVEPHQIYLRTVHEGKENQYGQIEYMGADGKKGTMSALFLAHDVRIYHKNKKELLKVQAVRIEGCKEIYGLMYFGKKGFFY